MLVYRHDMAILRWYACQEEVQALLSCARAYDEGRGFGVLPVGGRTNVTSATGCPELSVDPRPMAPRKGLETIENLGFEPRT